MCQKSDLFQALLGSRTGLVEIACYEEMRQVYTKWSDLQSRFGQVIRHRAAHYSCTNHDHVVELFLHTGLLYAWSSSLSAVTRAA